MGIKGRHLLHPSAILPPLRELAVMTTAQIGDALRTLHDLFCPLPTSLDFVVSNKHELTVVDSGYASEAEFDEEAETGDSICDEFERNFATRWLMGFIDSAYELPLDEIIVEGFVEEAYSILSYMTNEPTEESAGDEELGMTREFVFSLGHDQQSKIQVELYDTPMQTGEDHTDVGLQTWGASIILSEMISKEPENFRLSKARLGSCSRIVELGAGTGLVSLFLSRLIPYLSQVHPTIVATDYHPTVLSNLEANITSHLTKTPAAAPIKACHLDWSTPSREAPLDVPADILIAADVMYAPEHAVWLRDCASSLLADDGVFWLMVSVRPHGKFAGISDSVEIAFEDEGLCRRSNGKKLSISSVQRIAKRSDVGRADEVGYKLFEIVWSS
ncbi:hypothetical protein QQS21_001638 [Conoideocrella luteorostrata]|uniref:S-adenosylmethionine-dependent methyltransferase n=1 Tax=Conoideocrella luteorostrata TaxID=1105319 RepID=A0AAJ0G1Y0_9HYPO|nr:hypothetical protein QQS21_001638 [Conoideocrella luteorostrata]